MTSYNITKEQREHCENERRDSLARYLIHCKPERQQSFLKTLKSDGLREDLRERMKDQLALEISLMDDNMRKLRLARFFQRCQRNAFNQSFFQDITRRVNKLLSEKEAVHG
ncbi:hypothetical protein [Endozoicomonas sp. GU-1]|uniref:hypothetical protein n=1 Tax=Endozoicomonas sp. GU-1 TaxID=3009078 RepID=UPI0022B2B8AE|nr:hypothetical protein [Endozoicomonas sp. GU-1]WBA86496.1 hypothetical protein O3276_00095 [Endozoicomonas sp. GU-1]